MRRRLALFLCTAFILLFFGVFPVSAAEEVSEDSYGEFLKTVPKSAKEQLSEILDINGTNASIDFEGAASVLSGSTKKILGGRIYILLSVFAISIFTSMAESMIKNKSSAALIYAVSGSAAAAVLLGAILPDVSEAAKGVSDMSMFVKTSTPVLGGLFAACGQPVSGSWFVLLMNFASGVVLSVFEKILVPVINVFLALNIAGIFTENKGIASITSFLKKSVTICMGVLLTLFCSVLSMQTVLSMGADNVATKSVKFAVSGLIPFLGSAVSETVDTVFKLTRCVRSGVAVAGIITVILLFLAPVLKLCITLIIISISRVISGILNCAKLTAVLNGFHDCVSMCLTVTISSLALVAVSLALLVFFGTGG